MRFARNRRGCKPRLPNTVLAIKLARAVYFMLKSKTGFDPDRLLAAQAKK